MSTNGHRTPEYRLDHGSIGNGMLAQAIEQWRPTSRTEARVLVDEVLSQAQSVANTVAALLEHRAIVLDSGGGNSDLLDGYDLWILADLAASLVEVTRTVMQRQRHMECVEHDGCVAAQIREWPASPRD